MILVMFFPSREVVEIRRRIRLLSFILYMLRVSIVHTFCRDIFMLLGFVVFEI